MTTGSVNLDLNSGAFLDKLTLAEVEEKELDGKYAKRSRNVAKNAHHGGANAPIILRWGRGGATEAGKKKPR